MKNIKFIRIILVAMITATVFTACRFEDDDYFDESAALRIEHKAEDVQSILVNAPNGWVMQYFCGRGTAVFEGFNLFAKFENSGKVTIAGNHRYLRDGNANKYTESSSLYEMLKEEGLVLSFNTWNDVLTPFVDPVSPWQAPGTLVKDGAGMEGDQNLVIMSYNDNEIILRGERHGAEVRLVAADRSWADYIADTQEMKNYITNSTITSYYVTNSADTLYFVGLGNGRFRYCDRVDNPLKMDSLSCCFTPQGFRLEKEDTIGSTTLGSNKFHEFTLADDKSCLVNEDGTVKVIPTWDNYIVNRTAVWNFDTAQFSAEQKSLFEQIDAELKKYNKNCSLASIGLGKSSGRNSVLGLVITFYTNTAKTKTNTAGLALSFNRVAYGQMQIVSSADDKADSNLEAIGKTTEIESLARAFAATLNGIYEMTPDNYFLPTGGVFTAINGGTTFTLVK
ncbi:MAG: DUF4302 domain-containing protein [Prevotella sp.]|nr:DUF4302 domain-containing protein [Prevotella sp.]